MNSKTSPREAGEHALKQARRAAKQGDIAAAERWTRLAERMALAAQRLADAPEPVEDWQAVDARRAELRARIARLVEAEQEHEPLDARSGFDGDVAR